MSELDVSLPLFTERAGSLLYSISNSDLHTKAAGQAEALFMLYVTPNAHASNAQKCTLAAVG